MKRVAKALGLTLLFVIGFTVVAVGSQWVVDTYGDAGATTLGLVVVFALFVLMYKSLR